MTTSVTVIDDGVPIDESNRGPSSIVNTDGDVGSKTYVGSTSPLTQGMVPIPGDVWVSYPPYGTTSQRPSATIWGLAGEWYDTTLEKPIWSNGTVWKDALGNVV